MDDEDEGDVLILAFEEVNMFAVGGDFPRNISKLATLIRPRKMNADCVCYGWLVHCH